MMKFHRKIKHNQKVCCAQELVPMHKVKAAVGSKVKSCLKSYLSHNLKATAAILMKLYRKLKHNEKVCCIQDLNCQVQGQVHC